MDRSQYFRMPIVPRKPGNGVKLLLRKTTDVNIKDVNNKVKTITEFIYFDFFNSGRYYFILSAGRKIALLVSLHRTGLMGTAKPVLVLLKVFKPSNELIMYPYAYNMYSCLYYRVLSFNTETKIEKRKVEYQNWDFRCTILYMDQYSFK